MESNQIKDRVKELESSIAFLLKDFRSMTGFNVSDISIKTIDASSRCGPDEIIASVSVKLTV